MSSVTFPTIECGFETPAVAPQKRAHASVTNHHSHKRRRISSVASQYSVGDLDVGGSRTNENIPFTSSAARFVPLRPKTHAPLNITPRTKRISKQFGLSEDRVLTFHDDSNLPSLPSTSFDDTLQLLRRSAAQLFHPPRTINSNSVTENLTKRPQCVLTLDSPGIPDDPFAYPISWSRRNLIAVACGNDVYYQNLETKVVTHMFKLQPHVREHIQVIRWAEEGYEGYLAAGNKQGMIQVWSGDEDGGTSKIVRVWSDSDHNAVRCFAWNREVLAVGAGDGAISLFDVRAADKWTRNTQHRDSVLSLEWSNDGNYLASGDENGVVHIWDRRAGKSLLDTGESLLDMGKRSAKMRHKGSVKALAWCPWKSDLLATGSCSPEGKIRIWSSSNVSTACPTPVETFPLNTTVYSLLWSPHCKELLSTQGYSFTPPLVRRSSLSTIYGIPHTRPRSSSSRMPPEMDIKPASGPLLNSIVVHDYPSGKRLLTLTNAHRSAVTQSCLSPDGENVFTVCPKEETIKLWPVWKKREEKRRESAFDKCTIR
ncbi:WD40-repeat-containing domain protein [Crucibulum laeve]|uniref:WD40-repeat-containing domain protein n=1 Tax=Crucibulum laeve TaxID=68775 RepID=A0A5C3LWV0_9AGAR|nr:WD40-repeat-containing domain protein [Crucibulum laeve]